MKISTFNANHHLATINTELNKIGYEMIKRVFFGKVEFCTKELVGYCDLMDGVYLKKSDAVKRVNELLKSESYRAEKINAPEVEPVEITEVKTTKLKKYVRAINQQHQAAVSSFVYWDTKYNDLVDLDDDKNERKQEKAYNKAYELYSELPAREQKQLNKLVCGAEYYK